jgi:hypothetical protein
VPKWLPHKGFVSFVCAVDPTPIRDAAPNGPDNGLHRTAESYTVPAMPIRPLP